MDYLDFDLEIETGSGRDYPVSVRSPAGEADETMRFPYDEVALELALEKLQNALLRSGGPTRRALTPEERAVSDFGRTLFDALMTGEVRSRYAVSRERANQKEKGLRVRLHIASPELAALPWEYLYDQHDGAYLCLSRSTPLVRYLDLPRSHEPLTVAPPLRILGLVASPDDPSVARLNTEVEQRRLEQALSGLTKRGLVELHWLEGHTWRDLQQAMWRGRGPWHLLHFIGHGGFNAQTEEGMLALENEKGGLHLLSATQLGRVLQDHRSLRLVLLNACEGARSGTRDRFSSVGAQLSRTGIPAVLAMQYEITDRAALELTRTFYEALASGLPVDAALTEARLAINIGVNNSLEWGTPVLFLRASEGTLFRLGSAPPSVVTPPDPLPPPQAAPPQPTKPVSVAPPPSSKLGFPPETQDAPAPPKDKPMPRPSISRPLPHLPVQWPRPTFIPVPLSDEEKAQQEAEKAQQEEIDVQFKTWAKIVGISALNLLATFIWLGILLPAWWIAMLFLIGELLLAWIVLGSLDASVGRAFSAAWRKGRLSLLQEESYRREVLYRPNFLLIELLPIGISWGLVGWFLNPFVSVPLPFPASTLILAACGFLVGFLQGFLVNFCLYRPLVQALRTPALSARPGASGAGEEVNTFGAGSAALFLLSGAGTLVGIFTQAWPWAVGTVAVLFLLTYLLGYRKALSLMFLGMIALVSGEIVYGLTSFLSTYHYDQAQTSQIWLLGNRMLTLRYQLIAGAGIGLISSLLSLFLLLNGYEIESFAGRLYLGLLVALLVGSVAWLIVTLLGSIFNWGFGFGFGWDFSLLAGWLITLISGTGVCASIVVFTQGAV